MNLFTTLSINTVFENLEGFPVDWKTNAPAFIKFVREHQVPELPRVRRISIRLRRRDQRGAQGEARSPKSSTRCSDPVTLAFDDIQHILLTRAPAVTARYEFLSFGSPAGGRAWLAAILDPVHSAETMRATVATSNRWVTVAFTCNGLRTLGVDDASLSTFPEEFQQGMVARAEMLGDSGANHPDHWVGGLASPDLHAIVILFARDAAQRERCRVEHETRRSLRRREGAVDTGPGSDTTVRLRARSLRLPRPALPAGDRGFRRRTHTGHRRPAEARRVHSRLPG